MNSASIVATSSGLEFRSSFSRSLVAELKTRIPDNKRRPRYIDKKFDCWIVAPEYKQVLTDLCVTHLGVMPIIQGNGSFLVAEKQLKLLEVRYIGSLKDRGDSVSAYGYSGGDWSIVFPESALRQWFDMGVQQTTSEKMPLHAVLAVKWGDVLEADKRAPINGDNLIKTAWRKQAKRYHPDINRDEDAPVMMVRINEAYERLKTYQQRKKYQAGLLLVASLATTHTRQNTWQIPVRCGLIMAEGTNELGRFFVEKILKWEPIRNNLGQELVTSWPKNGDTFQENWI